MNIFEQILHEFFGIFFIELFFYYHMEQLCLVKNIPQNHIYFSTVLICDLYSALLSSMVLEYSFSEGLLQTSAQEMLHPFLRAWKNKTATWEK